MRLDDFFARIGPYLEGREDEAAARARLWPGAASTDAERLALYGRFCAAHRDDALRSVYAHLRATLADEAWHRLVEDYFAAHPMHHWELNENGAALPAFLDGYAARARLPAFAPALADFEWWEWRTRTAPDEPGDAAPDEGPLRIAGCVDVRPYAWDLCGWLDEEPRAAAPSPEEVHVIFWRDRDLDARRETASLDELHALAAVHAGRDVAPWQETIDDLHAAGILVGAR